MVGHPGRIETRLLGGDGDRGEALGVKRSTVVREYHTDMELTHKAKVAVGR